MESTLKTSLTEPTPIMEYRIGAVAERFGISERTLRYYEEFGLIAPSSRSRGGSRLYDELVVARVERIRSLQSLMSFNLEEIREILAAEDHIDILKQELRSDAKSEREVLCDAFETLSHLKSRVEEKQRKLAGFGDELGLRLLRVKNRIDALEE